MKNHHRDSRVHHHKTGGNHERQGRAKARVSQLLSFGMGGVLIVGAVAFAGHYMGENAAARGLPDATWSDVISPSTTIMRKSSLLGSISKEKLAALAEPVEQIVRTSSKGDFMVDHSLITGRKDTLARLETLIPTPAIWKMERNWKLGQKQKRQVMSKRRQRLAQKDCLARAVYFEARSESELGQLAVAKVILNRVKSKNYPNTICGVVYQGSYRKNSCQFSFACDGRADNPRKGNSWAQAKRVANRALSNGSLLRVISTATHYHADYVNPRWSRAMDRLIKIGNHIFYRGT